MEYLSLDILMEILSGLSVKELIRLKCVSKAFLDLISSLICNDDFIRLHLNKSSLRAIRVNKLNYLCLKQQGSLRIFHINRQTYLSCVKRHGGEEADDVWTMLCGISYGSCNGLVCLWPLHNNKYASGVLLWNPALRQTEYVPIKRPQQPVYSCWFGYDNGEYKLILGTDSHVHLIRLYVDTDTWKSSFNIYKNYCQFEEIGTLVHRTVHWPAHYNKDRQHIIITYDLRNETVGRIAVPDEITNRNVTVGRIAIPDITNMCFLHVLGQVDGCLSAMFAMRAHLELWVMKEYGVQESWTKLMYLSKDMLSTYRIMCYAVKLDDPVQLGSPIYGKYFYVESLISPRSIKP